jgi:acyl-CoA reductase-like NAD-dependent aldehyde dehydrogenase
MNVKTRPAPAVTEAYAYIDGAWRKGGRQEAIQTPIDGSDATIVCVSDTSDVVDAVDAAATAWRTWRWTSAFDRAEVLDRLGDLIFEHAEEITVQVITETGKLRRESAAEVAQAADILHLCAEEAKRIHGEVIPMDAFSGGAGRLGFTLRVPLGVIAGITPFNVPISAVCHKMGPALAAGNTFVLKPAPHGAGVATLLARLVDEAGVPKGVFNLVQGGAEVGAALVSQPAVRLITLTGSGRAAEAVIANAGLKQTLFELGGIGPTIVHRDADLEAAVSQTVAAGFALTGQSCVSTQKILVHEQVLDDFTVALVEAASKLRPGDPFDPSSGIGPLVNEAAAVRVEGWVKEAVAEGAELLCGGTRDGAYLEPTLLKEPSLTSRVVCEEIFGPVAVISSYSKIEDAVAAANDTPWGLKAGIFTSSIEVALMAARHLEFGGVNINGPTRFRLTHEPYGGVKQSGWGREGPRSAVQAMTAERLVGFAPVDWPNE